MSFSVSRVQAIALLLVLMTVPFWGCKEHALINANVSPANDTVGVHSMYLGCVTHTYFDRDVVTSDTNNAVNIFQAIGTFADSFFGTTANSTYFQINNPNLGAPSFDTAYHFDSAFLILPCAGYTYGDTSDKTIKQSFQVFPLASTMSYSTLFYPNSLHPIDYGNPLSDVVTVDMSKITDSMSVGGKNYAPALRMKLKLQPLMTRINAALAASQNAENKSKTFIDAFKGICVRPADTRTYRKSLPYVRLNGASIYNEAGIILHYHRKDDLDTVIEYYFGSGNCGHYNEIVNSYARYPVNKLYTSTQTNDSIVAIQNMPGSSIDVIIPHIDSIPKNVLINKVELQISLIPSLNNTKYDLPKVLFVKGVGNGTYPVGVAAGAQYDIEDSKPLTYLTTYANSTIIDGTAHSIGSPGITTYTIGLPREYMASLSAQNNVLHLQVRGSRIYYGAYRMLAAGGNFSNFKYRAKLFVVYSSLK